MLASLGAIAGYGAEDKPDVKAESKTGVAREFPAPAPSKANERMPITLPVPATTSTAPLFVAPAVVEKKAAPPDNGKPQVRLLAIKTDAAKKYRAIIPPLPTPPFNQWREWFRNHENAVHCVLEWRNDKGEWYHGELRSTHFSVNKMQYRVGFGEFPGTGYDAYGIFILPGAVDREKNDEGKPVEIALDEEVNVDYRRVEVEMRNYGAKHNRDAKKRRGNGKENIGLGGPAYKPSQNSNTMVKYILRACGVNRAAPDLAVGWDSEPQFPYSADADMPETDLP